MAEKKRGRPVKVDVRTRRVVIRLSDEEWALLDKVHALTGMSISNIVRAALRLYVGMRFNW